MILLTVASDNRSGATWVVALEISRTFDRISYACLLHKLEYYATSNQVFGVISYFFNDRQF